MRESLRVVAIEAMFYVTIAVAMPLMSCFVSWPYAVAALSGMTLAVVAMGASATAIAVGATAYAIAYWLGFAFQQRLAERTQRP